MKACALAAAAVALLAPPAHAQRAARTVDTLDVLIANGLVVDGSGGPARIGDVGVRGDRIVLVGPRRGAPPPARRTIDARGRIVVPGFIDPHTHTEGDLGSAAGRNNLPYLMQGVTTVVAGNDGGGPIDVGRTLRAWERDGIGTNAALYTGFGTVRERVLGMSGAAPTPAQLTAMRALVDSAMDGGALGLSTGLFYPPQSFASTSEVIALAQTAARHGGIYDSHLRDESSYTVGLLGSIRETLRIAREARIPVHVSHIKALGVDVWGQSDSVIALLRAARRAGVDATADQYPYLASGTSVAASLLPPWASVGGQDSLVARMDDATQRARLVTDMRENLRRRGGAASLLVRSGPDSALIGQTLADVAAARHMDAIDAALDIIRHGDAGVASFNMQERDVERFMTEPFVMTGSDGSEGMPRKYGTFPKKLHDYVFTKHLLSLPFAVRQSSARTAEALRIADRGRLATGWYADVVVFDSSIVDHATYTASEQLSTGVRYVLVNGRLAVDSGRATGVLAGRALRRAPSAGPSRHAARAGLTAALTAALATTDSLVGASLGTATAGAVLVVSRDGRVVHERAFGAARLVDSLGHRLTAPRPMRASTLFDLASVTKVAATTMAAMLLADQGRLDLDAPVARYLPDFAGTHRDSITIRHLLTHSAGLVQWQPLYYQARTANETYAAIRDLPLQWGVGAGRHYSDLGFMLLGHVIERITGQPLDTFVARALYTPLGLRHTTFRPRGHGFTSFAATEIGNGYERHMVYDSTFGYRYRGDPASWNGWRHGVLDGETDDGNAWYANGGVAGHAGLFSTAADLSVLVDLLVGRGEHGGHRYLRASTVDQFLTLDRYANYLGWMRPAGLPAGSFSHTGFTGTYALGVPAYGLSIVLLTNRQQLGTDARGYFPDVAPLQAAVSRALVNGAGRDAARDVIGDAALPDE